MQHDIFLQLSLVIAFGAGVAFIMRLLKQPLIIGHIITGLIVGPAMLHIISGQETIAVFAKIGIALLLFIIGLGLNPKVIRDVGKVASITGAIQIFITGLVGYVVAIALGRTKIEALFVGVALAFSSTIIILKLLSDKKEQTRLYGKLSIGILLIQDIVATIALIFASSQKNGNGFNLTTIGILAIKGLMIGIPMFLISTKILPKLRNQIAGSQEFLFLFAIGWGFGAAALFEHVGLSVEIGALFAGVALAGLPYAQEISARLRPLRDFFVIVFFISLGAGIQLSSASHTIVPILVLSAVVLLVKPLIVLITLGMFRYTKRTSFKASISLAQISEFSLVFILLGVSQNLIRSDLVSIITIVALITITLSTYGIVYADKLYIIFEKHLSLFERRIPQSELERQHRYELVLFGYKKGGAEFIKVFQALKKHYVVIDYDPEAIDSLEHHGLQFIYGDATDIELLEEIGLEHSRLIVSVVSDFTTNQFLASWLEKNNPNSVFICAADNVHQASDLYEQGAAYVMMPHYIGSEKIGAFIKKSGLRKSEFKKFREKHLAYLATHFDAAPTTEHQKLGHAILDRLESSVVFPKKLNQSK